MNFTIDFVASSDLDRCLTAAAANWEMRPFGSLSPYRLETRVGAFGNSIANPHTDSFILPSWIHLSPVRDGGRPREDADSSPDGTARWAASGTFSFSFMRWPIAPREDEEDVLIVRRTRGDSLFELPSFDPRLGFVGRRATALRACLSLNMAEFGIVTDPMIRPRVGVCTLRSVSCASANALFGASRKVLNSTGATLRWSRILILFLRQASDR